MKNHRPGKDGLRVRLGSLPAIRESIAASICERGSNKVVCKTCGKSRMLSQEELENYLDGGLLKCHGERMGLA